MSNDVRRALDERKTIEKDINDVLEKLRVKLSPILLELKEEPPASSEAGASPLADELFTSNNSLLEIKEKILVLLNAIDL